MLSVRAITLQLSCNGEAHVDCHVAYRVNSTIHALVVVVGVAMALCDITWNSDFLPMSSIRSASFIFSIGKSEDACSIGVDSAYSP